MESGDELNKDLDDIQKIQSVLDGDAVAGPSRAREDVWSSDAESATRSGSPDRCSEASSYQAHLTPAAQSNTFSVFGELTALSDEEQSQDVPEESAINLDDLEPTLGNALIVNQGYQGVLIDMRQELDIIQSENNKKQEALQKEIDQLNEEIAKNKKSYRERGAKPKKITFAYFGMPYFKDLDTNHDFNCPAANGDAELVEALKFRSVAAVTPFKPLTKFEVKKLYSALRVEAESLRVSQIQNERSELEKQKDDMLEEMALHPRSESMDVELKDLEKKIDALSRQCFNIKSCPDSEIFDVEAEVFDWKQISAVKFNRTRSPQQLRLYWSHYMSPKVNCSVWKLEENRKLKMFVEKYKNADGNINWKEVAANLNANRTLYACFRRFQDRYNRRIRKFGWSEEDNAKFVSLVTKYSDGVTVNYVDWEDIRRHFPGRTKSQLYSHLKYHTHVIDKSPFCQPEDIAILEGIKIGYNFNDIALLLGNRTVRQIRERYRIIVRHYSDRPWTEQEDQILLNLKDTSRLKKRTIDRKLGGRSFAQLFSRFHYLRMKKSTPAEYVEQMKSTASTRRKVSIRNIHISKMMYDLMKKFGSTDVEQHKRSMKSRGFPMYRRQFTKMFSEPVKKSKPYWKKNYKSKHGPKNKIKEKEAELKEILRPLINAHARRLRKISFPGDGREYGLVLASLHRLLNCDFTLAPPASETTEEDLEELGIVPENTLPVLELLKLVQGIVPPEDAAAAESISCLPPTLSTLTGYRGIDLHLKYLEMSASRDYIPPGQHHPEGDATDELQQNISTANEQSSSQNGSSRAPDVAASSKDNEGSCDGIPTRLLASTTNASEKDVVVEAIVPETSEAMSAESQPSTGVEKTAELELGTCESSDNSRLNTPDLGPDDDGSSMAYDDHRPLSSANDSRTVFDAEEEDDSNEGVVPTFGDPKADSMLLSRLLTLFYWPGIMSTMPVPPEIKEATVASVASCQTASPEPENATTPSPCSKPTKRETKNLRKLRMQALAKKRFGQKDADGNPIEEEPVAPTITVVAPVKPRPSTGRKRGRPPKKKMGENQEGDNPTSTCESLAATASASPGSSVVMTPDINEGEQLVATSTVNDVAIDQESPAPNKTKRTYKKRNSQPIEGGRVSTRRSAANQSKE